MQVTTVKEKKLARPLKVLVPIIKQDLKERESLRDEASYEIEIKIGTEFLEARSQLAHGEWMNWVKRNFHMSYDTAIRWMRAAEKSGAGAKFETLSEAEGDMRKNHVAQSGWREPVKDLVARAKLQAKLFAERRLSEEKERKVQRTLALRLIDIGYKILSIELHPDKPGGSQEAMQRLNAVRARLKDAA